MWLDGEGREWSRGAVCVRRKAESGVVRGLEWELEGKWGGNNGDKVKTKKEGENYHDRHAVLYLGFTLTVLGRQRSRRHSVPYRP